ncbi:MAG: membrane protein insertion efficiency factor YidD [Flectobacillus sp.]|uniref:membrane protein insertion efficiency factor YidD n=1 Tax=Flectobacillus sp. TaxID=50419 RepID=UPI003B9D4B1F
MPKHLSKILLLVFGLLIDNALKAQSLDTDLQLLDKKEQAEHTLASSSSRKKGFHPISFVLNGTLTFYQKVISPQFSANCLYELSCSRFSREAIRMYGPLKGIALSADRLARCNRISGTTINPFRVNEQGKVIDSPQMYK